MSEEFTKEELKDLLKALREAEEDVRKGRVRNWDEFLKEIKKE